MHKAYRTLMVLTLIGMIVQLPAAGWAADTRIPKAPEAVKSLARIAAILVRFRETDVGGASEPVAGRVHSMHHE